MAFYEDILFDIIYNYEDTLSSWEKGFLESISNQSSWSTRQFETLKKTLVRIKYDDSNCLLRTPLREARPRLKDDMQFAGDVFVIITMSNADYEYKKEILAEFAEFDNKDRLWTCCVDSVQKIEKLVMYAQKFRIELSDALIHFFDTSLDSDFVIGADEKITVSTTNMLASTYLETYLRAMAV